MGSFTGDAWQEVESWPFRTGGVHGKLGADPKNMGEEFPQRITWPSDIKAESADSH